MIDAGAIEIDIALDAGGIRPARVEARRPRGVARALVGRETGEAERLIGSLFPLCGMAHRAALSSAVAAARRHAPSIDPTALLAERIEAAAWREGVEAAAFLGRSPALGAVAAVKRTAEALHRARAAGASGLAEAGDLGAALTAIIDRDGHVATLMARAEKLAARGFGWHDRPSLGTLDPAFAEARLAGDPAFGDRPIGPAGPAEAGPAAPDLPSRIASRLAATRALPALLRHAIDGGDVAVAMASARPGVGAAVVETTRGPLAYRVEVDGDRLAAIASVAPTEWNFHPDGPCSMALAGDHGGLDPRAIARFVAFSFDPCVPVDVAVSIAAPRAVREDAHA